MSWPKYNAERHVREGFWCLTCETPDCHAGICAPDRPCRCCETARADEAEAAVRDLRGENGVLWKVADQQMAENEELRATLQRVREMHHPVTALIKDYGAGEEEVEVCAECGAVLASTDAGVCPTVEALGGAQ